MAEEYQPGLGLSGLRAALAQYERSERERAEEQMQNRQMLQAGAQLGKSAFDYWSMDQQAKYKDMLSQKIDGENVFEISPEYKDSNMFKRMFTPAKKRVAMRPGHEIMSENQFREFQKGPIDKGMDYLGDMKSSMDDKMLEISIDNIFKEEMSVDLPVKIRDIEPPIPVRPDVPVDPGYGGYDDVYSVSGDLLDSTKASATAGEASKLGKYGSAAGKALGALGTAYGAYNLATNWEDMSDSERAQGALQTIGGTMALTGFGAPIGLGLSAIGTIWDLLD